MKLFKPTLLVLGVLAFSMKAGGDIFDDIVRIMQGGNAEQLSPYFSDSVYFEFPGEGSGTKSQQDMTPLLKRFMAANPVKNVQIQHRGEAGKSSFVIARYVAANGKSFRLTIFVDKGQRRIREMKFENS